LIPFPSNIFLLS